MEYKVDTQNIEESNQFLRALWSQIRTRAGSCAWQYMPYKDGRSNSIHFGHFSTNGYGVLSVNIKYKKAGCIWKIIFEDINNRKLEDKTIALLGECVDNALRYKSLQEDFTYLKTIQSLYIPMASYESDSFCIVPVDTNKFNIEITCSGYDSIDVKSVFIEKINNILDLLSVFTNGLFYYERENIRTDRKKNVNNLYSEDFNWIDDAPEANGEYLLFHYVMKLIENVINDTDVTLQKYLSACKLYHSARKYYAFIYDHEKLDTSQVFPMQLPNHEVALVMFMSALEVTSEIDAPEPETCSECGQLKYSISRRVMDLVQDFCGDYAVKIFKGYYKNRSKYLHGGVFFSNGSYQGSSIPQLDINNSSGCLSQIPMVNLVMVKDLTSYTLRKYAERKYNTV